MGPLAALLGLAVWLGALQTLAPAAEIKRHALPGVAAASAYLPSMAPSVLPTVFSTSEITDLPSAVPSQAPSFSPSFITTAKPSAVPFAFPTIAPSAVMSDLPSATPSGAPSAIPTQSLYTNCDWTVDNYIESTVNTTLWYHRYSGISQPNLLVTWSPFVQRLQNMQLLTRPAVLTHLSSLSHCSASGAQGQLIVVRCDDPSAVSFMHSALINGKGFSVRCGVTLWQAAVASDSSFSVTINGTANMDGRFSLGVDLTEFPIRWPEWSQTSSAGEDRVAVHFELFGAGHLYCAAFPTFSPAPTTSLSVTQSKSAASIFSDEAGMVGELVIYGLQPDTTYSVLCAAESLWASVASTGRSPISASQLRANRVTTLSRSVLAARVQIPFTSWPRGLVTPAISVSPLARSNFTVVPRLVYVSSSYCSAVSVDSVQPDNNDTESWAVSPTVLSFDRSASSDIFFLQMLQQGCYALALTYPASDGATVTTTFITPTGAATAVLLINSTVDSTQEIRMQSAQFSSDGMQLEVRFTTSTDSGDGVPLPDTFPCSLALDFPGASSSQCWFESSTLIKALLPSAEPRPVPGDLARLLPNVVRPLCILPSGATCTQALQDFVPSNSLAITATNGPFPLASISAPAQISLGSDLTIDISVSRGNGGRTWSSVLWSVAVNYSTSVQSAQLESLMNNGTMQWNNCMSGGYLCDTLPAAVLTSPGSYSFRLWLANFAGFSSSTSWTVNVIEGGAPSVQIFGPALSSAFTNSSTILRAVPSVDIQRCPSIDISWLVYENGEVRTSLATQKQQYKDPRTLVIDPYVLTPGSEYRFGVTLLCDGARAYAEVVRLIAPCEVVPRLANGNAVTVSLNNAVEIDASSSFLSCNASAASSLRFEWSCVQRFPLGSAGCAAFYTQLAASNASSARSLRINQPRSVFEPDAVYWITVRVFAPGLAGEARQAITTLPDTMADVPSLRIALTAPEIVLDGSLRHQVDGFVLSTGPVLAEWKMVATNQTLASRMLRAAAIHYFPAVVAQHLLVDRGSVAFRLRAMAVSTLCADFSCAPAASIATAQVRVIVNQPPRLGFLAATPPEGSESTIFSLSALGWQDENLPLFYAFYQSSPLTSSGFRLIRHRMQVPHAASTLTASGGDNSTVVLRVFVLDSLKARAEALATVSVSHFSTNVTAAVRAVVIAQDEVNQLHNPEIVLPSLNNLLAAAVNCSSSRPSDRTTVSLAERTSQCGEVANSGAQSVAATMDKYNTGALLVSGLASYLESLSSVAGAQRGLSDMLDVFSFLSDAAQLLGVSSGDTDETVASLLQSGDTLVDLLLAQDVDVTNSTAVTERDRRVEEVAMLVAAVASYYMAGFPFGVASSLPPSQRFNASLQRGYWEGTSSSMEGPHGVQLSSDVFVVGATVSYSALVVASAAPFASALPEVHVTHGRYVELSTSALAGGNHSLEVAVTVAAGRAVPEAAVMLVRSCDELATGVTCSAAETGGPPYTFAPVTCAELNASALLFTCPLYVDQPLCIQSGDAWAPANTSATTVTCVYSLQLSPQTIADLGATVGARASLYVGTASALLSAGRVVSLSDSGVGSEGSEGSAGVSVVAIACIAVAGAAFAAFLIARTRKLHTLRDEDALPRTSAQFAKPAPEAYVAAAGVEGEVDGDLEGGSCTEALPVDVHALAFQLPARL